MDVLIFFLGLLSPKFGTTLRAFGDSLGLQIVLITSSEDSGSLKRLLGAA